jgi:hypothetical protein
LVRSFCGAEPSLITWNDIARSIEAVGFKPCSPKTLDRRWPKNEEQGYQRRSHSHAFAERSARLLARLLDRPETPVRDRKGNHGRRILGFRNKAQ